MGTLIARRLLVLVPLLLFVTFAVSLLVLLLPGDPAREIAGGTRAPEARVAEVRHQLHLDDGLFPRYGRWLADAATTALACGWAMPPGVSCARRLDASISITQTAKLQRFIAPLFHCVFNP